MPDKPQLPARSDPDLYNYLKYIRDRLGILERAVGTEDISVGSDQDLSIGDFEITYESPAVLAGTGETEATEDAWTTIPDAGAPSEARYALIQFYMFSNDDDAGGKITWRSASGSAEIEAVIIRADGTSDADRAALNQFLIPLTDGGFDYKADTTAGDAQWQIRRIGYLI